MKNLYSKIDYDAEVCETLKIPRRLCRGCQIIWFDFIIEEKHKNVLEQNKQQED